MSLALRKNEGVDVSIGQSRARITAAQERLWRTLPHVGQDNPAGCCWACGDDRGLPERAHLVAQAHGGSDEPENLILR